VKARKRFGQHFLEAAWAERLVAALRLDPQDDVLEIGPGRGALTFPLARAVRRLVAVELDRDLVEWLAPRMPPNGRLVSGDVLTTPLASLLPDDVAPASVRVVGNLPYNISSPILFRLIEAHRSTGAFRDATVMLQREVAERVAASPGGKDYGVLSIAVQLEADVRMVLALPPGAFRPVPAVSSAVVRLTFKPPAARVDDRAVFDAMVRALFTQRRKTVGNALKSAAHSRGTDAAAVLHAAGVDPGRRPETLDLAELAAMANLLAASPRTTVV
jgi:16S rRNA (adenine1518-N6/adenine1519-N6)-dimethyltransferase